MDNETHWHNKIKYLESVTGEEIVKVYGELNSKNSFTVATTPFKSTTKDKTWDCFIYYKTKYDVEV